MRTAPGIGVSLVFPALRLASKPSLKAVKRILLVTGLTILASARYVFVAPSTAEAISECALGSVHSYELLGGTGCTIDDKIFSNFTYTSSGVPLAPGLSHDAVSVKPLNDPGNPGMKFGGPWVATSGPAGTNSSTSQLTYDVKTTSGAALIKDASLEIAQSGNGDYGVFADESLLSKALHVTKTDPSKSVTFDPVALAHVDFLEIEAEASPDSGLNTATIDSVTVHYSEVPLVPEPSTVMLTGTGMVPFAFDYLRRRRRAKSQ